MIRALALTFLIILSGCASALMPNYTVIRVHRSQIYGYEAIRVKWPNGTYTIYLASNDPEVLQSEIDRIWWGSTFDRLH